MSIPLILSLDVNGTPHKWITWQDAVTYEAKDLVAWKMGEITFTFYGGKNRMTGDQSTITTSSIIAVKGTRAKSDKWLTKIPVLSNKTLFRRDQNICAYCGNEFNVEKLTRDHIIPKSLGGKDIWTNVVTACKPCNHRKGSKTLEQTGQQLLYVPYVPNRAEHLILANRKILGDQMEFLKQFLPKHSRMLVKM
ncbi:MAG: HNH endonuclease [Candidatus Woesearchaeota archaeon]